MEGQKAGGRGAKRGFWCERGVAGCSQRRGPRRQRSERQPSRCFPGWQNPSGRSSPLFPPNGDLVSPSSALLLETDPLLGCRCLQQEFLPTRSSLTETPPAPRRQAHLLGAHAPHPASAITPAPQTVFNGFPGVGFMWERVCVPGEPGCTLSRHPHIPEGWGDEQKREQNSMHLILASSPSQQRIFIPFLLCARLGSWCCDRTKDAGRTQHYYSCRGPLLSVSVILGP